MRRTPIFILAIGLAAVLAPTPALAQHAGHTVLHVDPKYDSCSFDLHPELTQAEFDEFADEVGSILRFRQLGETATLGKGVLDVSLQYASSGIDDAKGAWNNTMSHPNANHPLGDVIAFPRLVVRYGLSDRVDLGAWGTVNPRANYGVVGLDTNIALWRQQDGHPVSVSVRPSLGSLVGPSELWVGHASIDVSVGRSIGAFSPYVGFGTSGTLAIEQSDDVDLDHGLGDSSLAYAGLSYRWRNLVLSAEVEKAKLVTYAMRIGTRF